MKKQKFPHLLGSKWTARETTFGWRHFRVISRKNEGTLVFAELVSACDPSVRFWTSTKSLGDRDLWQPGWKTLKEQA
ncbi:TIGR02450 family Trp-rich protein [Acaryochloris thomasi]|uniref:TIGR02450 family Trp-rich protein n=1 Tax=Acaryochloris thomasi TaxID=2929456 RepID=UPI0018F1686A|nr:TIGR02450 family Trp-rich protein [Acaryochloris thomasi]